MDGVDGLFDEATARRLGAAPSEPAAGAVRLRIATLEPGQAGLLDAQVRSVAPPRTYKRKNGGDGLVARVTLTDGSGEVDLVLWDDETRLVRDADGPLQPGAFVRVHGPTVKAGYRGGVELGLGAAEILPRPAPRPASGAAPLVGVLVEVGEVRPVGAPPALRFTCDIRLGLEAGGEARVALWDGLVKDARALLRRRVILAGGAANPFLDGWWTADPGAGATLTAFPAGSATLK